MKTFVKSIFVVFLLFAGCDNTKKPHICPQCNMPLPKSNINTSNINEKIFFDDIGCLVLYAKEHNINLKKQKIKGIFSSPPYVGLIDYHEQHAYAYDLFGFKRNDELEIGPLYKGQGREARNSYIDGIVKVLNNSKQYLQDDYDIFLVANDKYNMYPTIAEKAGMKIVNQYKRPVLSRTEKNKSAYAEIIFHLKEK